MRILGLDMSSKKSGYALLDNNELVDYGCWEIDVDTNKDWRKRILYMSKQLNDYFLLHNIDKVYVEDVPPITQNSQTVKVLSALQGCLMAICEIHKVDVTFVPVTEWKNIIKIDLSHSSENKQKQKEFKANKNTKGLTKLKDRVKAYEKKMSIDYANKYFDLDLKYVSPSSKKNQDDIADAINIAISKSINKTTIYNIRTFNEIIQELSDDLKEDVFLGRLT